MITVIVGFTTPRPTRGMVAIVSARSSKNRRGRNKRINENMTVLLQRKREMFECICY